MITCRLERLSQGVASEFLTCAEERALWEDSGTSAFAVLRTELTTADVEVYFPFDPPSLRVCCEPTLW